MQHNSADNVSVIFIAFKNFEDKMKDPNFEYTGAFPKVKIIKEKYDFGLISKWIKNSVYLRILNIINLFNNFKENKIISIILVNKLKNIFKFK